MIIHEILERGVQILSIVFIYKNFAKHNKYFDIEELYNLK